MKDLQMSLRPEVDRWNYGMFACFYWGNNLVSSRHRGVRVCIYVVSSLYLLCMCM